ncbi:cupin domain-containing protein [Allostreptomyces psammosilenae]|uniref:Quercetin dioxygenase-like cupin family protein n=1 Tax=Allostreptomyces psammosilenae TaxID=1892865 RepID=A0A853A5T3_9ACTN|nr:cupin domain-containing protein [Allostreptomyces psammosilenae]NYI08204.1 quercetin dioxygenase-like cupin family protein [Allostreptomyces psammosilenae]
MPLSTRAEAPTFTLPGFTFHPLATPSRGSAELAVWTVEMEPAAAGEPHSLDREEVFVVVSGRVSAVVGGEEWTAGPGDALTVPPGTEFALRNASAEEPARLTVATTVGVTARLGDAVISPPWAR